eukprot:GFYU01002012.1.p1 GENE.GFYU01002012.1~~GFYU01002012.1.p1  ORF type:complete len:177 (+),score=19.00 GFYU01002012.1:568-1098(+)
MMVTSCFCAASGKNAMRCVNTELKFVPKSWEYHSQTCTRHHITSSHHITSGTHTEIERVHSQWTIRCHLWCGCRCGCRGTCVRVYVSVSEYVRVSVSVAMSVAAVRGSLAVGECFRYLFNWSVAVINDQAGLLDRETPPHPLTAEGSSSDLQHTDGMQWTPKCHCSGYTVCSVIHH